MTDIIQELRSLIAKATPGPWAAGVRSNQRAIAGGAGEWIALLPNGHREGFGLTSDDEILSNAALIVAAINHLPALLDRLEAAEPWRKHYFDMAKAAGDLKAAVRPQLDAMPFADHVDVRKAFNDIAVIAGRALDHLQPKAAPAIDAALVGEG